MKNRFPRRFIHLLSIKDKSSSDACAVPLLASSFPRRPPLSDNQRVGGCGRELTLTPLRTRQAPLHAHTSLLPFYTCCFVPLVLYPCSPLPCCFFFPSLFSCASFLHLFLRFSLSLSFSLFPSVSLLLFLSFPLSSSSPSSTLRFPYSHPQFLYSPPTPSLSPYPLVFPHSYLLHHPSPSRRPALLFARPTAGGRLLQLARRVCGSSFTSPPPRYRDGLFEHVDRAAV